MINYIKVENFGGVTEKVIKPDKITVFLGNCGTGKSSIMNAIRFGLTGTCDREDIRNDTNAAQVTIGFDDGSTLLRKRGKDGTVVKVNGKRTTAKAANVFLNERLHADTDTLEALCGTDFFEALSQKEMTGFFLSILPVKINFESICKMINSKLAAGLTVQQTELLAECFLERKLTQDERDAIPKKYPSDDNVFNLSDIDNAYKTLFERRKSQKKVVASLTARAIFEKELPKESKEELEEQMSSIARYEALAAAYQKELNAYERAVKAQKDAEDKKKRLEESLKAYDGVEKPDEQVKKQAQEDKIKFQNAIGKSKGMLGTISANIRIFSNTLNSLNKPVCPISEKLVCTTDKTAVKSEISKAVSDNEALKKEHEDFIGRCEEQIRKRDNIIQEYDERSMRYLQKVSICKQIAAIILPEVPEKPKAVASNVYYTEKKREIREKQAIYAEYEAAKKVKESLEVEKNLLFALEICVMMLDVKTGIRSDIMKNVLGPFESLINDKAAEIRSDFKVRFSCEEGIEILVSPRKESGFVPLRKVSGGEFVFVAYLLMTVVNAVTNSGFLMIDSIDRLDRNYLTTLLQLLDEDDSFENIFIGGVNHTDTVEAAKGCRQVLM